MKERTLNVTHTKKADAQPTSCNYNVKIDMTMVI